MLRLGEFQLHTPASVDEAAALLREHPGAILMAGGTDLVPKLKRHQFHPEVVVSLSRLDGMREIVVEEDALVIGAQVTLRALERSDAIRAQPALAMAVAQVATPLLRNTATIGGNLLQDTRCHYYDRGQGWREGVNDCLKLGTDGCRVARGSDHCYATLCSDIAPVLAVLDAELTLVGETTRTIEVADLYREDGMDHLHIQGEILTQLRVPLPAIPSTYRKLRTRASFDFPELGVALALRPSAGGFEASVAVTAVASSLLLHRDRVEDASVEGFIDAVHARAKPMDTLSLPPDHRKRVLRNLLRQAFDELLAPGQHPRD